MKSVLLSIKPKYCKMIANGEKTIEVRKVRPQIDTPFKCYIYCTKTKIHGTHGKYLHTSNKVGVLLGWNNPDDCDITIQPNNYTYKAYSCVGKVIGEFICDKIIMDIPGYIYGKPGYWSLIESSCLNNDDLMNYGKWGFLYGWHISELVIYDKPKCIDEFKKPCSHDCKNCKYWYSGSLIDYEPPYCEWEECVITRPPQSWCYIEEVDKNVRA